MGNEEPHKLQVCGVFPDSCPCTCTYISSDTFFWRLLIGGSCLTFSGARRSGITGLLWKQILCLCACVCVCAQPPMTVQCNSITSINTFCSLYTHSSRITEAHFHSLSIALIHAFARTHEYVDVRISVMSKFKHFTHTRVFRNLCDWLSSLQTVNGNWSCQASRIQENHKSGPYDLYAIYSKSSDAIW